MQNFIEIETGKLYAYDDDVAPELMAPGLKPVSDKELAKLQAPTGEQLAANERAWRDAELVRIDIEINKATDAGGDTSALRAYRMALRGWPEKSGFPNPKKRPSLK